ncbi:MAG: nucleoid DNA-binding protein [Crocinitomicaceae bacterium]|jgi:nucleoid DNA-binding protein
MDQYLLQILKETNTIIIPGLGALTITNATTGEVMFMPYLKHDDGKLSAHIAAKEGIEENEAKNIVAKHVREIKTSLDKGDSYDMFQFGTFSKGADGDIEFENWEADKATPVAEETPKAAPIVVEEPKTETPKAEEPVKEKPASKVEAPAKTPEPKVAPVEKPVEKQEPAPKVEKPQAEEKPKTEPKKAPVEKPKVAPKDETPKAAEKKVIPVVVPVTPPTPTSAPKKEMNIADREELSKSTEKLEKLKKEKAERKSKKKRGVGFYMLMVILLLIIAGGTYFAMDYENLKQHVPFLADTKEKKDKPKELDELKETIGDEDQEPQEVIDNEMDADPDAEVIDNENPETDPVVEETPEPQPEPVAVRNGSNDQPFHIVAGAFGSIENANRLVEKLKGMGYPAKTFARGAQNIVSVQSYATRAEAQADMSNVQDGAPKGWVLEWR